MGSSSAVGEIRGIYGGSGKGERGGVGCGIGPGIGRGGGRALRNG